MISFAESCRAFTYCYRYATGKHIIAQHKLAVFYVMLKADMEYRSAKKWYTKNVVTCILALPHWEMACQAVPAPSEMKLRASSRLSSLLPLPSLPEDHQEEEEDCTGFSLCQP